MTGYISALVCNVLTIPYPIYASFKAIESSDKKDDTQWLTFWIIWACTTLLESMTDIIMFWIPLYFELKLGFFILLQLPKLNLSETIYRSYLKPYLIQKQKSIDTFIAKYTEKLIFFAVRQILQLINPLRFLHIMAFFHIHKNSKKIDS
jgi:receptor expression-enhancing protein 5/6